MFDPINPAPPVTKYIKDNSHDLLGHRLHDDAWWPRFP
jgi:hypothetical protein